MSDVRDIFWYLSVSSRKRDGYSEKYEHKSDDTSTFNLTLTIYYLYYLHFLYNLTSSLHTVHIVFRLAHTYLGSDADFVILPLMPVHHHSGLEKKQSTCYLS